MRRSIWLLIFMGFGSPLILKADPSKKFCLIKLAASPMDAGSSVAQHFVQILRKSRLTDEKGSLRNEAGSLYGGGKLNFNPEKKEIYIADLEFAKELQETGIGTEFLQAIRESVPDDWNLTFKNNNDATREVLFPLVTQVQKSKTYTDIKAAKGNVAATDYFRHEMA